MLANLGPILGYLGAILGPSWAHLGPSSGHLGPSWSSSWAVLGPFWGKWVPQKFSIPIYVDFLGRAKNTVNYDVFLTLLKVGGRHGHPYS